MTDDPTIHDADTEPDDKASELPDVREGTVVDEDE